MGRRGRPYQVPEDRSSRTAATIEVDSRVGWLLLMWRLHHRDIRFIDGTFFNTALAVQGVQVDRSVISRWESGYVPARQAALAAYESVLGLRPGQISSVALSLRRVYGEDSERARGSTLDPSLAQFHDRLDELIELVSSPAATGANWADFGQHVAAAQMVYLPSELWQRLAQRVVDQLGRSVGLAATQRFEATQVLLHHQVARPRVIAAVQEWLADPAAPHSDWLVRLLETADDTVSGDLLIDQLVDHGGVPYDATVSVVARKAELGHYNSTQLFRIEALLLRAIHRPVSDPAGVVELVEALPESARRRLMKATAEKLHGAFQLVDGQLDELVPTHHAASISDGVNRDLRARMPMATLYDVDKMTPRLIRDALFSARYTHRHYASAMLQASPFRDQLAEVLAIEIHSHGLEDAMTPHLARVLSYVITADQQERVTSWLSKAPIPAAYYIARALGSVPGSITHSDELVAGLINDGSRLDSATVRILGMRGDAALHELARNPEFSEQNRASAAWWLKHGTAVFD